MNFAHIRSSRAITHPAAGARPAVPHRCSSSSLAIRASASGDAETTDADPNRFAGKRALVIGGTGRVGSSSASAMLSSFPGLQVTLASRSKASYDAAVAARPELSKSEFKTVDINDKAAIKVGAGGGERSSRMHPPMHACGHWGTQNARSGLDAQTNSCART